MATFVHSYPLMAGDYPFGPCFDGIASPASGCLMTPPPPYRINTPSPASRSNLSYQQTMNQVSFFDEAIGTSSMPMEVGLGIFQQQPQQPQLQQAQQPQFIVAPKAEVYEPSPRVLPTVEAEQKAPRQPRTRKRSLENSDMSETGASGPTEEQPRPKKRGRKPKGQQKEPPMIQLKEESEEEDIPRDPRRRRILERNRIAATKCRLRKRDEASALASREQAMEDHNRYLSTCFDSLTAEIYHLKTQLLQHTDCGCVLIQKYIANEARKSVDGLLSCSSAFQHPDGPTSPYQRDSSGSGTSGTGSLSIQTPEMEGSAPTWTDPFQQASRSSEGGDDMFDMVVLEPFQKEALSTSSQPMSSVPHLSRCDSGVFVTSGPQPQSVDGLVWDSQWGF